jgi:rod shape determining protein RodA
VPRYPAFDWPLFILGLMLSVSGAVYVYSATWKAADPPGVYFSPLAIKQIAFIAVGVLAFYLLRRINWGLKPGSWLWFYVPVVVPLLLVLFLGHGGATRGATRWIDLGVIDFQPSELAKVGFLLTLAWLYSGEAHEVERRYWQALAIMVSLVLLMLLQPDLGTSLVFLFTFFVVSALTPLRRRILWVSFAALVVLSVPAWFVMRDYQKNRIMVFFGYEIAQTDEGRKLKPADPRGVAYQLKQSQIAVGSGGVTGKGFLHGTQTRGGFIPVLESDFIFALVAEEFGLVGCLYLLALYFLLLARIIAIARTAKTPYEAYISYGSSAVIFFHVFVAAGITMRLMPVTGLPMPFVSYGGSAMLTMWLLLAVNESIFANSRRELRRG